MTEMGLSIFKIQHMYENAQIDLRTFIQLSAINVVGFLIHLGLYFFSDADKLGVALWSLWFLTLAVVCAIMAKKSHKAVQHWKKVYDEAIERESRE